MITINIDLGSAQEIKALVIYDHNLSATATITLKGIDPTIFSEAITWNGNKIIHYLSVATTKRYWQLQITDDSNTDGYIEIGELYLGGYLELSKGYNNGFSETVNLLRITNATNYGIEKDRFYNQQKVFLFDYTAMSEANVTNLKALITAISNRDSGIFNPFWFNLDEDDSDDTWFVKISSLPINHLVRTYYNTQLELVEVVTSL